MKPKPYLITYDISDSKLRNKLQAHLVEEMDAIELCESSYLLKSIFLPEKTLESLKKFLLEDDRLAVFEVCENFDGQLGYMLHDQVSTLLQPSR